MGGMRWDAMGRDRMRWGGKEQKVVGHHNNLQKFENRTTLREHLGRFSRHHRRRASSDD